MRLRIKAANGGQAQRLDLPEPPPPTLGALQAAAAQLLGLASSAETVWSFNKKVGSET